MPNKKPDRRTSSKASKAKTAAGTSKSRSKKSSKKGSSSNLPKRLLSAVEVLTKHLTDGDTLTRSRAGLWKPVFLAALKKAPIVSVACEIAGISRKGAYQAREADADFAKEWDEALEIGIDCVEAAAFKSAVYGDEKPIYQQGMRVGTVLEYSDSMRTLLLKGRRRNVFGEKVEMQHSGQVGMTLEEFRKRVEEAKA